MNAGTKARELIELIVDECSGYDDIGRHVVANQIIGVLSGWLQRETRERIDPAQLVPMTTDEARRYAREVMAFGKYAGKRIGDITDDQYLEWLADQSRETWRNLWRYLHSPWVRAIRGDDDEAAEAAGGAK